MGVPSCDVRFLRAAVAGMERNALNVYRPSRSRVSQAIVLRFKDGVAERVAKCFTRFDYGLPAAKILEKLQADLDEAAPSSLHFMLIKRAEIARDQWSGQVTFPGGRRSMEDVDDRATVVREVYDELGIPLDSPEFVFLGRLSDYELLQAEADSKVVVSRFVFLHIGLLTPTVKLARHTVQSLQWVPLALVSKKNLRYTNVRHRLVSLVTAPNVNMLAERRMAVTDFGLGTTELLFPSLPLPRAWNLWGGALSAMSELNVAAGRDELDWPRFRSDNRVVQHIFVDAYHGYQELFGDVHRVRNVNHVQWLVFDVAVVVFVVGSVAWMVGSILLLWTQSWLILLKLRDQDDHPELVHFQRRAEWAPRLFEAMSTSRQITKLAPEASPSGDATPEALVKVAEDARAAAALEDLPLQPLPTIAVTGAPQETSSSSFVRDVNESLRHDSSLRDSWQDPAAYEQELQHGGTFVDEKQLALRTMDGVVVTPEEEAAIKTKYGLE